MSADSKDDFPEYSKQNYSPSPLPPLDQEFFKFFPIERPNLKPEIDWKTLVEQLKAESPIFFMRMPSEGYPAGEVFPSVNLSKEDLVAALGEEVEFSLVEGSDGMVVAKIKGKSPNASSSDE
jgi:hypothetical protein